MTIGRTGSATTTAPGPAAPTTTRWPPRLSDITGYEASETIAWLPPYVRALVLGDLLAIVLSVAAGYFLNFPVRESGPLGLTVVAMVALPVLWVGTLMAFRAYEARFLGVGTEEYDRVMRAAVLVLALVATGSWAFKLEVARGFVVIALPMATLLTLVWRYAARRHLHARRARGESLQSMIIAGHGAGVLSVLAHMSRSSHHGMQVVGVCLPRPQVPGQDSLARVGLAQRDIPVVGYLDEVAQVARRLDVDSVVVLPSPELDGPALRQLGWDLEASRAELLLAPVITEMIGPRVAIRPVNGLSLLHLNRPEHTGSRRIAKALFDRTAALAGLTVLALPMLAIALAVRMDSRGPAFYRQERIGKLGQPFEMLKFRSMVTDAEDRLIDLRERSEGNGVLFKMRADPRVTRVGRFLRAYSLDELPQLINVVRGEMSLVGPRPPLAVEVARYGHDVSRRLLVKPGLTGLWQINGRSDLSWEESVRLDLRYVENWSFAFDFAILWKTFRAVVARSGAY
ncbi:MAG: Exopolysaccharide biosynthesis polyprenyl glycosylphosphotransferase [uncultured Quadrisphaera sp.]|uniref:Exopolysaccharide biosynthesis polyprenyl glycosylphosphotransferase n=1 Tax=uncultured Quadrisphaera sp. TaxID=904978 RepID=A0A6J4Q178_9ACTN|nr:MAG: Exopolysaccharide biosynthesis polyprenyl glycosylphosphotransferase [uncultured Quadrisphaera sp.]